mgnify:CR=1 FL=1
MVDRKASLGKALCVFLKKKGTTYEITATCPVLSSYIVNYNDTGGSFN